MAYRFWIAFLDGGNQFVGEVLALDVDDAELRMRAAQNIGNRVHQVGFAQAGVAVDEQRVVFRRGPLRDRKRRRVRKLVARADDKPLEGIVVVRRGAGGGRRGVFAGHDHDRDLVAGQLIERVLQRLDELVVDEFLFEFNRGMQNQTVVRKGNNRRIVEPG